jgi:hypothetical protein
VPYTGVIGDDHALPSGGARASEWPVRLNGPMARRVLRPQGLDRPARAGARHLWGQGPAAGVPPEQPRPVEPLSSLRRGFEYPIRDPSYKAYGVARGTVGDSIALRFRPELDRGGGPATAVIAYNQRQRQPSAALPLRCPSPHSIGMNDRHGTIVFHPMNTTIQHILV